MTEERQLKSWHLPNHLISLFIAPEHFSDSTFSVASGGQDMAIQKQQISVVSKVEHSIASSVGLQNKL